MNNKPAASSLSNPNLKNLQAALYLHLILCYWFMLNGGIQYGIKAFLSYQRSPWWVSLILYPVLHVCGSGLYSLGSWQGISILLHSELTESSHWLLLLLVCFSFIHSFALHCSVNNAPCVFWRAVSTIFKTYKALMTSIEEKTWKRKKLLTQFYSSVW